MALQKIDTIYGAVKLNGNLIPTFTTANVYFGNAVNRVGSVYATSFDANATSTFANIIPNANVTANIGSSTAWFNTFFGVSTQARYADLAENYRSDQQYEPGTVLEFGGSAEVTLAQDGTRAIAGVVSTNPAYLMNGGLTGTNVVSVAQENTTGGTLSGAVYSLAGAKTNGAGSATLATASGWTSVVCDGSTGWLIFGSD